MWHWIHSYHKRKVWNHRYIEKDKTEPFHIPTDWTVSHLNRELGVVTSKKTKLIRSTSQQTEPFPIWTENSTLLHRKSQNWSVPHPNRLNRLLHRKKQNWAVPHPNRLNCLNAEWWMMMDDEWSRPSCVTESTELVHITRGKTELIPSWLCNRKHSSSSKCSTEKSHQFISKVSQKLDYCVSTHTHEFHPNLVV